MRALRLRLVGVHRRRLDSRLLEVADDPVGAVLRAGEDEHRVHLRLPEQLDEQRVLPRTRARDRRRGVPCSPPSERRPTCTTIGRRRYLRASASTSGGIVALNSSVWRYGGIAAHDAIDLRREAHVEHPIRFVEHENLELVEETFCLSM